MKPFILAAIITSVLISPALSACKTYTAPGKFNNKPPAWGTDSGPIVDGFILPKGRNGTLLKHAQGVDLSRYNEIDYRVVAECGGKFAFVQMDRLFDQHLQGLKSANVIGIPYYFLKLPAQLRKASALPTAPTEQQIGALRKTYGDAGRKGAAEFLAAVEAYERRHGAKVPTDTTIGGLTQKFVALDVEQSPKLPVDLAHARQYGRFYAVAICAWIKAVEAKLPGVLPLMYTFPMIYGDYLSFAYTEENQCLQGYPVWIARTYPNGWEALTNPKRMSRTDQFVQRLCLVQGGNRCLIHQYTHRGVFMALKQSRKPPPTHFDLDRFYDAKRFETAVGPQFVRVEDPFTDQR